MTGHKKNKFLYYIGAVGKTFLTPRRLYRSRLPAKLSSIPHAERDYLKQRVNQYNKLTALHPLSDREIAIGAIDRLADPKVYSFDSQEYLRYFDPSLKIAYEWGDVTHIPDIPTFVKSRPILTDNSNSVLLKLNKIRHFNFLKDPKPFLSKKNLLIGRGTITQPRRIRFYEQYFHHPMCDLGQTNRNENIHWLKNKVSIKQHLNYKFILALEGNDVASNLKWVMSSNSLAVMPTPRFETWFMESTLIPDYHYVHIKDDYSDLEEKLTYYIAHPAAALEILNNAHAFVEQFKDDKREDLLSLLVIEKYLYRTGQLLPQDPSFYDKS